MLNKFLYIDDSSPSLIEEIAKSLSLPVNSLEGVVQIQVDSMQPLPWNDQLQKIIDEIKDYDGIILDWRLTEENKPVIEVGIDIEKKPEKYSAEALAQQIRILYSTEKQLPKDVPIVVCSSNDEINEREKTGYDLFDEVYDKDKDFVDHRDKTVVKLNALADAYKVLPVKEESTIQDLANVLSLKSIDDFDPRLINSLVTSSDVPHNFIRFLLNEVIKKPGVLIDEDMLAARLGIDKESSPDFQLLLEKHINPYCLYKGILSNGWKRWWAEAFISWWKTKINQINPQRIEPGKRVELLKQKAGLQNLVYAKKLKHCKSNDFWTVCVATRSPIDPADGFLILENANQGWQESQYVSMFALREEKFPTSLLNPIELKRYQELKRLIRS